MSIECDSKKECSNNKVIRIITINQFKDYRGSTDILFDTDLLNQLGINFNIHQINQGHSYRANTLRGLHFQLHPYEQAKLVWCVHGSIYSVAVDIRPESSTFGAYVGEIFSVENQKVMYIPRGFAHGYLTLEDDTLMQWCVDNDFNGDSARALRYDDPDVGIVWPNNHESFILSEKDKHAMSLKEIKGLLQNE